MVKRKKKKETSKLTVFGSVLTGFALGSFIGWYIGKLVSRVDLFSTFLNNQTIFQQSFLTVSVFGIIFRIFFFATLFYLINLQLKCCI